MFAPESVVRRVNREAVLLLGGGRALLLQVAHPLVAAGVAAHSRFRSEPLGRLWRTLDLMLTIVFGAAAEAIAAVRAIDGVHARVQGVLDADVGRFARGARYDARDPELLLWVHATLIDSALVVFDRFVAPLDPAARSAYYEESKAIARLLGIPDALLCKEGPLTPEERIVVKQHAELSARIVEGMLAPDQVRWIRDHHEKPDGTGYPQGLSEGDIPDGAALLAVADAWDAMTAGRPYSAPKPVSSALSECIELVGCQFTKVAVGALMKLHAAGELDAAIGSLQPGAPLPDAQ